MFVWQVFASRFPWRQVGTIKTDVLDGAVAIKAAKEKTGLVSPVVFNQQYLERIKK